jgi:hypothetical protein
VVDLINARSVHSLDNLVRTLERDIMMAAMAGGISRNHELQDEARADCTFCTESIY